jgi:AraC-like DNA-binding protein
MRDQLDWARIVTPDAQRNLANDEKRAWRGSDDPGPLGIPGGGLLDESGGRSARSWFPEAPAAMSAPHAPSAETFSTDDLPESDRVAMWREHFGRIALRVEIEPTAEGRFESCITSRILPGLHLLFSRLSAARITRTRELIADDNDDFVLVINRAGNIAVSARGREVLLREGDALLRSSDEVTVFERLSYGASLLLRIPRSFLSSADVDIDGATMRVIPRQSDALKLLTSYTMALIREHPLATPSLQHLAVSQVSDLVALTLGATRDAACTATVQGLPAAKLRAAKSHIVENCGRRNLSIGVVAAHVKVTPRYLQRLFEADGKTFSEWLLHQRLMRVHRMLCRPEFAERTVSAVAYEAGFGDLSYFNRCFRKLYGVTPRDVKKSRYKMELERRSGAAPTDIREAAAKQELAEGSAAEFGSNP